MDAFDCQLPVKIQLKTQLAANFSLWPAIVEKPKGYGISCTIWMCCPRIYVCRKLLTARRFATKIGPHMFIERWFRPTIY